MSTKMMPLGSAPLADRVGTGDPVAITWNDAGSPTVKVVELALVMAGAEGFPPPPDPGLTTSVKTWLASGATPVDAHRVNV